MDAYLINEASSKTLSESETTLKNLYMMYDFINVLNFSENTIRRIYSNADNKIALREEVFSEYLIKYAEKFIHPSQRDIYLETYNVDTVRERLINEKKKFIINFFRTWTESGDYVWKAYIILRPCEDEENVFYSCIRDVDSSMEHILIRDDYIRLFNDMPMAYAMYDVIADESGTVKDIICVFASNKLIEMMGATANEVEGKSILKMDYGNNAVIINCMQDAAYEGKSRKETFYLGKVNRWITATFDQAAGKGRCAVIFEDVTKEKLTSERLGREWRTDDLIISCIKLLHGGRLFDHAIDVVFGKVGATINATRIYLLEKNEDGSFSQTHEWMGDGISSRIAEYQNIPRDQMTNWEQEFLGANSFIVDDISTLKNSYPRIYRILSGLDATSLVEVPVCVGGQTVAYLGTMGQDNHKILDVKELMEAISYFIAAEFSRRSLLRELERKSTYDSLCGVKNRNAMEQDVKPLKNKDISVGVIYGDANGLKAVNDNQGHEAGDALLKSISKIMVDRFGNDSVYRAGGDEFVIILPAISEDAFIRLYQKVEADFENTEGLSVALGCSFTDNSANIETTMREADKKMYENKANYYRKNNRRKNRE